MWTLGVIFCILFVKTECSYYNIKELQTTLLNGYNADILPVTNNNPLHVFVKLFILSLKSLDEKTQVLTISNYWQLQWKSDVIKWNETDHNFTHILVKARELWLPEIFIDNTNVLGFSDDITDYVKVRSDGIMTWYSTQELKTSCAVDVSNYPFDTQGCHIKLESWYHDNGSLVYEFDGEGIQISEQHWVENGEWEVLDLSATADTISYSDSAHFSGIEFIITLKRRPFYHIITTVIPLFILISLNCLSMVIPTDSGEKLGFCMSNFLTMIVFLTLVTQNMPCSSFFIARLTLLITSQVFIGGITTTLVAISIHAHSRKACDETPFIFQEVCRLSRGTNYKIDRNNSVCNSDKDKTETKTTEIFNWQGIGRKIDTFLAVLLFINVVVSIVVIIVINS